MFASSITNTLTNTNTMKNTFTLQNFLSENRNTIIAKHSQISAHKFYNGISLRDFMLQLMGYMQENNPRSDKRAASLLASMLEHTANKNTSIGGSDFRTETLKAKYEGTAYMSMV